jgi:hypothetical protein
MMPHFHDIHMASAATSPLGRAAGQAVLHAEADEVLGVAVLALDGDADDDRPLGVRQPFKDAGVYVDGRGHLLELAAGHLEGRGVLENWVGMMVRAVAVAVDGDLRSGHGGLLGHGERRHPRGGPS